MTRKRPACLFAPYAIPFRTAHDAQVAAKRVNHVNRPANRARVAAVRCGCCGAWFLVRAGRDLRWARQQRRRDRYRAA